MNKKASIILLTCNSQKTINDVLKGIFSQKTSIEYDVLVIDSSSSDSTIEIVGKYPVKIEVIKPEAFNHGETRNLGASLTKGSYIVFLSHDAVPTENWLEPLVNVLNENEKAAGAYSRQIAAESSPLAIKRALEEEWTFGSTKGFVNYFPDISQDINEIYKTIFFTDVSSCIKRSVWEKIPFRRCEIAEDILWASDVLKKGYCTIYQPESIVIHSHVRKVGKHYRDNYNHAMTMKRLILVDDILGLKGQYIDCKKIERLSTPLNLHRSCFLLLTQLYKDLIYILGHKENRIPEKFRNLGYSILWQSASVIGNYLGYRAKINK